MLATCGKLKLSENAHSRLQNLGQALHAAQQPFVFDDGFVSLVEQRESEVNASAQTSTRNRSEAGSRQGRRKPWRPRSQGEVKPFRSRATEEAYGAGFRLLSQHYEAVAIECDDGLWVAVNAKPLGDRGPLAYFLIAAPNDPMRRTVGWAFSSIGSKAQSFPFKHTNFPDASICAFTNASGAWKREDGLLPLVDHYALWAVKSWHKQEFGWWPGAQVGACGLYRRREFAAAEFCGCESGKKYSDCHMASDLMMSETYAQQQFNSLFRTNYDDRKVPELVMEAARTRWRILPNLVSMASLTNIGSPVEANC